MVTLAAPTSSLRPATAPTQLGFVATTAIAPLIWGTTYLVTTQLLPPGRPLLAGLIRALPAGLAILIALSASRRLPALPTGAWWWRSAVLGFLNIGLFFPLLFLAAYLLPGGVAALAGAIGPFVVAALALPLLRLTPSSRMLLAGSAGLLGVGLVVARSDVALDPVGLAAAIGGMLSMSLGTVLGRRWGAPDQGIAALTGWQLSFGGLLLIPPTLLIEGIPTSLTSTNVLGYAYLTLLGGIVAYSLWVRGVARLAPTQSSMLSLLSPIVATFLGWLVLDQALGPWQLLGAALTLGAVALGATAAPQPRLRGGAQDFAGSRDGPRLR